MARRRLLSDSAAGAVLGVGFRRAGDRAAIHVEGRIEQITRRDSSYADDLHGC